MTVWLVCGTHPLGMPLYADDRCGQMLDRFNRTVRSILCDGQLAARFIDGLMMRTVCDTVISIERIKLTAGQSFCIVIMVAVIKIMQSASGEFLNQTAA